MDQRTIAKNRMPERRTHRRYGFTTTLRYRLMNGGSPSEWKSSRTQDMSVGGFRMNTEDRIPDGSSLEIVMDWNGLFHGRQSMRLWVEGQVVRSEDAAVAVRILRHEFREGVAVVGTPLKTRIRPNLAVA